MITSDSKYYNSRKITPSLYLLIINFRRETVNHRSLKVRKHAIFFDTPYNLQNAGKSEETIINKVKRTNLRVYKM